LPCRRRLGRRAAAGEPDQRCREEEPHIHSLAPRPGRRKARLGRPVQDGPEPPPRLPDFPPMTTIEPSNTAGPDAYAQPFEVAVEGHRVLVTGPRADAFVLTADAAQATAERLLEAADKARRAEAAGEAPPFPPSELVSPHAA
jgi:hypothetical protein